MMEGSLTLTKGEHGRYLLKTTGANVFALEIMNFNSFAAENARLETMSFVFKLGKGNDNSLLGWLFLWWG
ncbi:hypothetical protein [Desulfosporosinus sp. SB140]|uniref:hypothetical protein n=1 Tax=Desulfosporosinus paludis TaxID=3115649 RepID=UPI00388D3DD6